MALFKNLVSYNSLLCSPRWHLSDQNTTKSNIVSYYYARGMVLQKYNMVLQNGFFSAWISQLKFLQFEHIYETLQKSSLLGLVHARCIFVQTSAENSRLKHHPWDLTNNGYQNEVDVVIQHYCCSLCTVCAWNRHWP